MGQIKICVGSLNPTKINAVKIAFSNYYENFELYKIKADSKVPNQPIGMEVILTGAKNRAESALNYLINSRISGDKIFGIGIEGTNANFDLIHFYFRSNLIFKAINSQIYL